MAPEKKTVKEAKAKKKPVPKEAKKAKKPAPRPKTKKPGAKKAKEPLETTGEKKEQPEAKPLEETPEKEIAEEPKAAEPKKEEKPKKKAREKKAKPIEKIEYTSPKKPSKESEELLSKRKNKPRFLRQEFYKLDRLKDAWRKSRGIDSKKHEGKKGKGETPAIGYKNPAPLRGLHEKGYYPVLVHNTKELEGIDNTKQAAIIAGGVGRLKRNEIIKSSNKLRITILNPRKGETQ
ncbi:MAG: hypothetical protein JW724_02475 [Candidatus Altiarchaeota archaeon]|nr:hypothetical protein [Candidatus Altiarchaeota archaeon]